MSLNHMKFNGKFNKDKHFIVTSRRDDLESLLYNMMFLAKGSFPWKIDNHGQESTDINEIMASKNSLSSAELFKDLPSKYY